MKLPREKHNHEEQPKDQPHVLLWHVLGKTQLRQDPLPGQAVCVPPCRMNTRLERVGILECTTPI
jgi:hypothetical protein